MWKILIIKNDKRRNYQFYHPEMGYTTNENEIPSDCASKALHKDPIVIVDIIEICNIIFKIININELVSIKDKLEKAKYYLALLYWESTLTTYVNFCWRLPAYFICWI